jgi:hypothetical protein
MATEGILTVSPHFGSLFQRPVLYQGMTSVVPKGPQNQRRL